MSAVPEAVTSLVRRRKDPIVVQTVRSCVGAVLAYVAALGLTDNPAPLTAPLTALLVIQVSLYATWTTSMRRVVSVVVGVLIASGFSAVVGLSWWSLGLVIIASLVVGHMVRVDEFVPEVAISAMLVLGVSHVAATAWSRVAETLIGAATGVLFNALFAPPVMVQPAGEAIADLAGRMRRLLERIGRELRGGATPEHAVAWLQEARRLDQEIVRVDAALDLAQESMRFNPRVRRGLLARLVLRSGLDTLEICAVVLRTLSRSLTDLSFERGGEPVYPKEVSEALFELFAHVADAVDNFGRLITAQVTANAERAEAALGQALAMGRADRRRIARLLQRESRRQPERWQLHGALLANVDRLLNELDVEKRSQWLAQELDRHTRTPPARRTALQRMRRKAAVAHKRARRQLRSPRNRKRS
ncbi:FUSC family protein [Wenjunlia tyrosinilytica]|uniref:FUSC family protein n=1 Tax=Wenjunlia tyrosinilytica TaxID=1544741 RepID=A0A917ZQE5_9ACTN|nr:aromatic acid exporter family protein [Wenjunlia tyrosinilytica]GGO87811.1 FUSC family protein [Wenjunlia tyrosinilytica]